MILDLGIFIGIFMGILIGIFMGIFIGMFEICVYAPGPAKARPPPWDGSIYCPYEIFPLPLWCGRGCVALSPSPPCGVVGVWYCPPSPLSPVVWWGCGMVCWVCMVCVCVWSVWYGMSGKYGMFSRYGMYGMNCWYCMDGRYGM